MSATNAPLLASRNLRVSVPGRLLVEHLELTLDRGEFIAVMGRNGTGKTISLLTLAGVVLTAAVGLLPIVTAASAGCLLLMVTGALRPREAYESINWQVVFMLAGGVSSAGAELSVVATRIASAT